MKRLLIPMVASTLLAFAACRPTNDPTPNVPPEGTTTPADSAATPAPADPAAPPATMPPSPIDDSQPTDPSAPPATETDAEHAGTPPTEEP